MARPLSPSASRRAARETALRVLYMLEIGKPPIDEALDETIVANELDETAAPIARLMVSTVTDRKDEIDAILTEFSTHYPPEKQTVVDRNILRLGIAELRFDASEAAPGTVANESVELAKKYSTPEAARFVNGVLGGLIRSRGGESSDEIEAEAPVA